MSTCNKCKSYKCTCQQKIVVNAEPQKIIEKVIIQSKPCPGPKGEKGDKGDRGPAGTAPTDYVSNVVYNDLTTSLEFTGIGNAFAGTVDLTALKDDTNSFISNVELIDNELVFTATGVGPFSGAIDLASLVVAGGAVVSADNGLGIDPANNVQLGGTLFKNTNIGLSTFDFTLNTNLFSATGTTNGNIVGVGTANGYIDQVLNASTVNAAKFVVRTLGSKYGINHNNGIVELSSYIAEGELAAAHWGTTSNHSYYWITNNLIRGAINRNSGNFTLGNTNDLSARLAILGQSSTSSNFALKVQNSALEDMFNVVNSGRVNVGSNQSTSEAIFDIYAPTSYGGAYDAFRIRTQNGTPRSLIRCLNYGEVIVNTMPDTDASQFFARIFSIWGNGLIQVNPDSRVEYSQYAQNGRFSIQSEITGETNITNYNSITNSENPINIARKGVGAIDAGFSKIGFSVKVDDGFISLEPNNLFLTPVSPETGESLYLKLNSRATDGTDVRSGSSIIKNVSFDTASNASYLSIGEVIRAYRDSSNNPDYVQVNIPTLGLKTIEVGAVDSGGTGYRMLRVLN
jgi:hypothetical protein